ncbi:MAG: hypothetical protein IPJ32_08210, partial [Sphingobacteriaceae bacterium]|nr:hypothetical protein [Sphingobacteriaceae bacterium]
SKQLSKIWKDSINYLPVQYKDLEEYLNKWRFRSLLIKDNNNHVWVEVPGKLIQLSSKKEIVHRNKYCISIHCDKKDNIRTISQLKTNCLDVFDKNGVLKKSITLDEKLFPMIGFCEGENTSLICYRDHYVILNNGDLTCSDVKYMNVQLAPNTYVQPFPYKNGFCYLYRNTFGELEPNTGHLIEKLKLSKTLFGKNYFVDSFNSIWVGSDNGIYQINYGNKDFLPINLKTKASGNWIWRYVNDDSLFLCILNDFDETVGGQSNEDNATSKVLVFKSNPLVKLFEDSSFKSLEFVRDFGDTIVVAGETEIGYYSKSQNRLIKKISLKQPNSWRRIHSPVLFETYQGLLIDVSKNKTVDFKERIKVKSAGLTRSTYDRKTGILEQFYYSKENFIYRIVYDLKRDSVVVSQKLPVKKGEDPDFKGTVVYQKKGDLYYYAVLSEGVLAYGESYKSKSDSLKIDSNAIPEIDHLLSRVAKIFLTKNHFGYLNKKGLVLFTWNSEKLIYELIKNDALGQPNLTVYSSTTSDMIFVGKQDGITVYELKGKSLERVGFIKTILHKTARIVWCHGKELFLYGVDGITKMGMPDYSVYKAPCPFIESIKINNRNYFNYSTVTIDESKRNIEIKFNGLDFSYPDDVLLSYRIKELDTTWKEFSKNGILSFNDLDPGKYNIEIAAKSDVTEKVGLKTIFLIVEPMFIETIWFKLIIGICGVLIVVLITRWRTRQLLKKQKELEDIITERTFEISQQKHLIEEKQKEVMDSIRYARRIQSSLLPTEKYIAKFLGRFK